MSWENLQILWTGVNKSTGLLMAAWVISLEEAPTMGTHSKPREEFTLSGGVILYSKCGMWNNKEWNDFVEMNNSPQQGLNQQIKSSTK